jgi:hypothetical protein
MREKLSSRDIFQKDIQVSRILREAFHLNLDKLKYYNEGMINSIEDKTLVLDMIDLLRLEDLYFF